MMVITMSSIQLNIDTNVFNKKYLPYLQDYSNRYLVFYGSGGSGKSRFIVQRMVVKLLILQHRKLLVVRKVDNTLRDSVFQEFKTVLTEWNIVDKCIVNKSDMSITFPNGNIILFKGLQDPERIKSISGITDIWIEEASEVNKEDFNQLDLRLRSREQYQEIILSYNPVSKDNWVYTMFHKENKLGANVVFTTYKDNRFLPESYINSLEMLRFTNPTYYKIYALGEFGTLNKVIYNNWERLDLSTKLATLGNKELRLGCDYGFVSDPTAILLLHYDKVNNNIYIFDEIYKKEMLTDDIVNSIKARGWDKVGKIIGDSAEPRLIREMQIKGIPIRPSVKGKGSILQGITFIQQHSIYVDNKCKNTINELRNYAWVKDKSTLEYINKPVDRYNHALDALRYGVEEFSIKLIGNNSNVKAMLGL